MRKSRPPNSSRRSRSVIRRLAILLLKGVLTIILIAIILIFLVQTPYVQGIVRVKAERYLSRKLNTPVAIGNLAIGFPRTVLLENVYIADRQKDTLLEAGLIHVDLDMWGLLHNTLDIREFHLADLTVKVKRTLPDSAFNFQFIVDAFAGQDKKTPAPKSGPAMKMYLRSVLLDKIRLVYKDAVTGDDADVWIEHNQTRMDRFDPAGQQFSGQIELQHSILNYRNTMTALAANLQLGRLTAGFKTVDLDRMNIALNSLSLDSTNIQFDNDRQRRQKKGMDYAHLKINGLALQGKDFRYTHDSISGNLTKGEFKERSGFELDKLQTTFLYADKQAYLKDLELRTPGSLIQRNLTISYASLSALANDPTHTLLDLDLRNSKVQVKDILVFVPSLANQPVFGHPADTWMINSRMQGSLASLRVATLQFSGIQDMKIDLSGTVQHITDTKRIMADLDIRNMSGSRRGLVALLPARTLPSKITIPDQFALHGKLAGGMDDLRTDLVIATSSGSMALKGSIRQFRDMRQARYDLVLQTRGLDLGYILQDRQDWGRLTADIAARGTGFDPQTANAKLNGVLHEAVIKQYDYREFRFDASIADRQVELQSSIHNTAVRFELKASANLANKFPALRLDWQIDTLDLFAMHLIKDTLGFKGHLLADFSSTDPDSLQGSLRMGQIIATNGGKKLATDSIVLVASRTAGLEDISFKSEMADLDWKGQYKITEVPEALKQTLDKYFHTGSVAGDTAASTAIATSDRKFSPEQWQMNLKLRLSPLVLAYMPSLKGTDSIGAQISFNSDRNDLQLSLNAPRVEMGAQVFHRISLRGSTNNDRLSYGLQMAAVSGSGYSLHGTSVQGYLANDRLFATLVLKDDKNKDRYRLSAEMDKRADNTKIVLNPDSLLLNYDRWQVSRDNFLQFGKAGIVVNDLKISQKDESLQVNSRPPTPSSPIDISFSNFRLATLSRLANQDSLLVDGLLNGKAELKEIASSPLFTSDLTIKGLTYKRDTVGDLTLKVNNEKANAYTADISLEGNQNDVRLKGDYYAGEGRVDMKLDLKRLNLAAIKPFATSQLEDIKGYLKGSLAITGILSKPAIDGKLHFDSTMITPVMTGEPLKLSNDNIEFDADGFNFSQFAFLDSANNKATIDGNVYTKDYKDYDIDVTFNANNFRLVNAAEARNRLFYGKMNLDAAINLTGDPLDALKVDGDIRVNKKTNFVFVLPENNPEVVDRLGVVRFVDKDHPGDTLVDKMSLTLPAERSEIKGFDVSLTAETDSSAIFTMVIDERNGDALTARGRSNMVFGMDKSGKTDLTGTFEVESGSYNLSLDVLKRKFEIQHGSTITWTGDPTLAILDVNATYTANTPSIDLIANEVAGRPQADINKFNQKLPFLVTLKMEDQLLKPKITFDITLPEDVLTLWPDVDAKLNQIRVEESELNKQVFALLLLNRFVGEDPLQSAAGGGSTLGNMAFQSASQILTNQLDQLAGSLIKGVDIHFDLNNEQDFSTGTEQDYTALNVSVSKQLFNERVQVNVGSNFDVQGAGNPNQNASNIAGDLAVDYKLTQDGRYLVRAYRKNQYEAVVEGEVVETGVSFILTFDYDKFRELFGRTKPETFEARKIQKGAGKSTPDKSAIPPGTDVTPPAKTGTGSN
jgi:TamB, inner membrane protein subunit of TAM complex